MEKSPFFAEGEPSKLSESFLVAGVAFLYKNYLLDKNYLEFT